MSLGACVVFDIDDTLYLERDYVRSGLRAVATYLEHELGGGHWFPSLWELFESGARGDLFDRVLAARGTSPDAGLIIRLVEVYRAHPPAIAMLEDAVVCVAALRGRAALAVVSDGPLVSQESKAGALGLGLWAAPIVFTAALGPECGKPHPRAFALVQQTRSFSPGRCVYVADNPGKDFTAPRRLGWKTVRVRRNGGLHAGVPSGRDVDLEVAHLRDLPRWLEEQGLMVVSRRGTGRA